MSVHLQFLKRGQFPEIGKGDKLSALGQKLKAEWRTLRNWRLFCVFLLLGYPAICIWYSWIGTQALRISTITGTTHFVGLALPAMNDTEAHIAIAKKAATAIFTRIPVEETDKAIDPMNIVKIPATFPFREDLVRIVNTETQLSIKNNWEANSTVFREQNITQYFLPSRRVVEQSIDKDLVTMTLDGDLFTNSKVPGGSAHLSTEPTRVTMNLRLNPDFPANGKFEFVVVGLTTEKLK